MAQQRPKIELTCFPDDVLLACDGEIVPKKVYARVQFPEGTEEKWDGLRLFVRVRPSRKLGMREEPFTDATKGEIGDPQLDDPDQNYCMELIEGYSPFEGGRPVPGAGWFEVFDLEQAGVQEDVEVEVHLFWDTGKWCADRRMAVRRCSHPARLVRRFPLRQARGLMAVGDLDGDGELDFILSAGAGRQTAYASDGKVLWDHADSEAGGIQSYNCLFPIYDIDGDGRNEFITVRRDADQYFLCILDGQRGEVKKRTPMPEAICVFDSPPMVNVQIANLRGLERAADVVFSHHYSDATAFDNELNVLWRADLWGGEGRDVRCKPPRGGAEARFPYGFAHTPAFGDVDGDGHDEMVAGASLVDHDGRFVWNRKDLPRINYDHNDSVAIADLERDGRPSILLSTGLYCLDPDGNVRWGFAHTVCHGQHVWAAPIIPGSPRLQVLLVDWRTYVGLEPPHVIYLIDGDGTVLWHRISGWARPVYWSACGHQDVWLSPEGMPGMGEVLNHEGRFLGYLPMGSLEGARAFCRREGAADTLAVSMQRNGEAFLELYECSVPPEPCPASGIPRAYRDDDARWSLY